MLAWGGPPASAFAMGLVSAGLIGFGAVVILTWRGRALRSAVLPSVLLFLLLWPAG
jgi:hypothetical protein